MKLKVLTLALLSTYATHSFAEDNTEKTSSSPALKSEGSLLESPISKDLAILIGTKVWYNTWNLPIAFSSTGKRADSDMIVSFESNTKLSPIPQLGLKFQDVMLTTSYFAKTKYEFGFQHIDQYYLPGSELSPALAAITKNPDGTYNVTQGVISTDPSTSLAIKTPVRISPTAERSEFDLNLGYYLTPNVAVTLGYKQIDRNYTYRIDRPFVNYVILENGKFEDKTYLGSTISTALESKGKGVALGITGSVPIGNSLNLYGSMAYGLLRTTYSGSITTSYSEARTRINEKYTNPYYLGELGVNYTLPASMIKAAIFSLGYRFQRYEFKDFLKSGQNATDTTDGFAASINVVF